MRTSVAALALIRRETGESPSWLTQWNDNWRQYSFVGGHKHPAESFRECILREIAEELGLLEVREFVVANESLTHLEYRAWSERAQTETAYTMELFDVRLVSDAARCKVDADPRNRWLGEDEIQTRCCRDGKPVSETVKRLLDAIGNLIPKEREEIP